MLYPTGNLKEGRSLVCMEEMANDINEALCECNEACVLECFTNWLNENAYCVECSQLNEYLKNNGYKAKVNEDAMAAPAAGFNTLGNVNGMGNPATPSNGGTNAGFYDSSKSGSGDTFGATTRLTRKSKKRSKLIKKFQDFIGGGKKVG